MAIPSLHLRQASFFFFFPMPCGWCAVKRLNSKANKKPTWFKFNMPPKYHYQNKMQLRREFHQMLFYSETSIIRSPRDINRYHFCTNIKQRRWASLRCILSEVTFSRWYKKSLECLNRTHMQSWVKLGTHYYHLVLHIFDSSKHRHPGWQHPDDNLK